MSAFRRLPIHPIKRTCYSDCARVLHTETDLDDVGEGGFTSSEEVHSGDENGIFAWLVTDFGFRQARRTEHSRKSEATEVTVVLAWSSAHSLGEDELPWQRPMAAVNVAMGNRRCAIRP